MGVAGGGRRRGGMGMGMAMGMGMGMAMGGRNGGPGMVGGAMGGILIVKAIRTIVSAVILGVLGIIIMIAGFAIEDGAGAIIFGAVMAVLALGLFAFGMWKWRVARRILSGGQGQQNMNNQNFGNQGFGNQGNFANPQPQQFDQWGNPVPPNTQFDQWGNPIPPRKG